MANRSQSVETVTNCFSQAPKSLQTTIAAMQCKDTCSLEGYDIPRQHIKKQRCHFADKSPCTESYDFSSSYGQMWELDHKGGRTLNNWWFWIVVLEKTLENPLDCKKTKTVNAKRNQPWIFIRRTDAEAEAPILWPPHSKSQLIGKNPDAGKDRRQEEKETTEDEMAGWHHWLDGHEFE